MGEASPASPTQGQWLPDHLVKHCMMCSVGFSIFQRKHHCRMCGGIYCSECSTHKLEGQRICDLCYERAHNLRSARLAHILGDHTPLPPPGVSITPQPAPKSAKRRGAAPAKAGGGQGATAPSPQGGPASAVGTAKIHTSADSARDRSEVAQAYSARYGAAPAMAASAGSDSKLLSGQREGDKPAVLMARSASTGMLTSAAAKAAVQAAAPPAPAQDPAPAPAAVVAEATAGAAAPSRVVGHGDEAAVAMNDRMLQLEANLKRVQGELHAATHADALPPDPFGVLLRSELLAAVLLPLLYALARLQWWVLPITCWSVAVGVSLLGIGQGWTLGSWLGGALMWCADGLFSLPLAPLASAVGVIPLVGGAAAQVLDALRPSSLLWLLGVHGTGAWTALLVWFWLLLPCAIVYAATAESPGMQLFRRRMRVYGLGATVFFDYKLAEWFTSAAARGIREGEDDVAAARGDDDVAGWVWEAVHRRNAARVMSLMLDLRGLWVKAGQYLSSRPDVMPDTYIRTMSQLQDGMPARPLSEVRAVIEADMGRSVDDMLTELDATALAAASVGQVHRGVLPDGSAVAIKVQHKGMEVILDQDLKNLGTMLDILTWAAPSFDLKSIMDEWSKEVAGELDFKQEASNTERVRRNMAAAKLNVTLPRIIPGLVGDKVMAMRFVPGVKASDRAALLEAGVNLEAFVHDICCAFAHQIYVDGFFNGDPHPGNIMAVQRGELRRGEPLYQQWLRAEREGAGASSIGVEDGVDMLYPYKAGHDADWIPVLLDFGLTKSLEPPMRLAFAKLVVAGEEMDYAMLLEAFDEMGMKFSSESAGADMENLQHMFRDALPADEARAQAAKREEEKAAKAEAVKKAKETAAAKRAERAAARKAGQSVPEEEEEEEERQVDAWPSELMFFLRSSELLQGLSSHLRVRYSFMGTMAAAARTGLKLRVPASASRRTMVYPAAPPLTTLTQGGDLVHMAPTVGAGMDSDEDEYTPLHYGEVLSVLPPPVPPPSRPWSHLESLVADAVGQWINAGGVQGMQVSVWRGGACLVDVAAGSMGPLDSRPVTPATLFPVYGAGRLAVAAATQDMLQTGAIPSLESRVSEAWPAFDQHGKGGCTVRELLCCRSGVEGACADKISTRSLAGEGFDSGVAAAAAVRPMLLPSYASALRSVVPSDTAHVASPRPGIGSGDAKHGYVWGEDAYGDDDDAFMEGLPPPDLGLAAGPTRHQESVAHLYFGWGWAVAGWLAAVGQGGLPPTTAGAPPPPKTSAPPDTTGLQAIAKVFREHVRAPYALAAECVLGTLSEHADEQAAVLLEGTHSPAGTEAEAARKAAACALTQRRPKPNAAGEVGTGADCMHRLAPVSLSVDVDLDDAEGAATPGTHLASPTSGDGDSDEAPPGMPGNTVTMAAALAAMELVGTMERGLEDLEDLCSGGKEHIMDPRLVNGRVAQRCPLPNLNVRASARALAKMASALAGRLASSGADTWGNEPVAAFDDATAAPAASTSAGTGIAEVDMLVTTRRVYPSRPAATQVVQALREAAPGRHVDLVGNAVHTYARIPKGAALPPAGPVSPDLARALDPVVLPSGLPRALVTQHTLAPATTVQACRGLGLRPMLLDTNPGPVEALGAVAVEHPMLKANTSATASPRPKAPSAVSLGFGVFGLGGNLVFVDPANKNTAVAITVSQLSRGRQPSLRMLAVLARGLGIRIPAELTAEL